MDNRVLYIVMAGVESVINSSLRITPKIPLSQFISISLSDTILI